MIRDLGFNYARIPVSYQFIGTGPFARTPNPARMHLLDRAIEFGDKYDVHITLGFHRVPGYCVNSRSEFDTPERGDLFKDPAERNLFADWWGFLAAHFEDVSVDRLSFNLLNEPTNIDDDTYERVFTPAIEAIEAANSQRLIHADGTFIWDAGSVELRPAPESIAHRSNIINSVHLYHPLTLTHYGCPWTADLISQDLEEPTWPHLPKLRNGARRALTGDDARVWDRDSLRSLLSPYLRLAEKGYAVHVGEMGAFSRVRHDVYLSYMSDVMSILRDYDLGFALWNLRGPFGVVDTGRLDAILDDFAGHKLDRSLLSVLRGDAHGV